MNGNGSNGSGQQHDSILIDTSSIPLTQSGQMPPNQHQHHPIQPMSNNFTDQDDLQQQQISTITSQPGATTRVAPENQCVVYSVHPIFNILDQHDTLLVRQKADPTSTCCGFESLNTYTVRGKDGEPVLKALEYSNCCERCCFEGNREYNLSLVYGEETVARIKKPYRLSRFCCYSNAVCIESPEDNPIGYIRQQFTFIGHARYAIFDCQQSSKTPTFLLKSTSCRFCFTPFLCTCLCPNKEFKIYSVEEGEEVGTISRHWQHANPEAAGSLQDSTQNGRHEDQDSADLADGGFNDATEMRLTGINKQANANDHDDQMQQEQHLDTNNSNQNHVGDGNEEDFQETSKKSAKIKKKNQATLGASQVFGIQFEPNLEARHKVLLLSACFMMDFFYFENDRRRRKLASC